MINLKVHIEYSHICINIIKTVISCIHDINKLSKRIKKRTNVQIFFCKMTRCY